MKEDKPILQHLIRGWGGLAKIITIATDGGYRIPDDELKLLEAAHSDMEIVLKKQRTLGR